MATPALTTVSSSDGNGMTVEPLSEHNISKIPHILPHERVFPIQIGSELFKLSGASLSSDAPSYFSQYFLCQLRRAEESGEEGNPSIRTLYIDRDPGTFRDISLHLQGYHVSPRDGKHFVRLFADAQFYSLPKLISQLYEESIFISIGHREFQIPRDIFQDPGNSPNFFSLGFAVFFSRPDDLFPGLEREGLIRPPSILPPSVPNRSADTFADLIRLLRGYPVHIRDEVHRQELLRDAKYFHFKGLEQRLIPHSLSYNQLRRRGEIVLRVENVQKSGISVSQESLEGIGGWVHYARPYVDDKPAELVLEIGGESTKIHFSGGSPRAEFFRDTRARVARLFEVIATKLNLTSTTQPLGLLMASGGAGSQPATPGNTPLSEDLVRVIFDAESAITLDGKDHTEDAVVSSAHGSPASSVSTVVPNPRKRRRTDGSMVDEAWTVKTGQWRLKVQSAKGGKSEVECVLVAVKIDAI
ncbi:Fc.00g015980.m01.CDS01 [Cosmosporella sp. VM-42]